MPNIKVLLSQKVENLGDIGEIVSVRAGYARNFLLPKGVASLPTIGELKRLEKKRAILEAEYKKEKTSAELVAKKIEEISDIEIFAKAGEAGKLFGSVTTKEIVEKIEDKSGIKIPRKQLLLRRSITELGEYNIPIKLHSEVTTQIKIIVKAEEE